MTRRKIERDFVPVPVMPQRWRKIVTEVTAKRGVEPFEIFQHDRRPRVVAARTEVMGRMRTECGASLPRIGRLFCMHHTTVMHAVNRFKDVQNMEGYDGVSYRYSSGPWKRPSIRPGITAASADAPGDRGTEITAA